MTQVVLDTCTLLWLTAEPERLSRSARDLLSDPGAELTIYSISAWEIAIKVHKRKLELPVDPLTWWDAALARYRIRELPVTGAVAMASVAERLPHNDPADRIIVATARLSHARLVTGDRVLLEAVPFALG